MSSFWGFPAPFGSLWPRNGDWEEVDGISYVRPRFVPRDQLPTEFARRIREIEDDDENATQIAYMKRAAESALPEPCTTLIDRHGPAWAYASNVCLWLESRVPFVLWPAFWYSIACGTSDESALDYFPEDQLVTKNGDRVPWTKHAICMYHGGGQNWDGTSRTTAHVILDPAGLTDNAIRSVLRSLRTGTSGRERGPVPRAEQLSVQMLCEIYLSVFKGERPPDVPPERWPELETDVRAWADSGSVTAYLRDLIIHPLAESRGSFSETAVGDACRRAWKRRLPELLGRLPEPDSRDE